MDFLKKYLLLGFLFLLVLFLVFLKALYNAMDEYSSKYGMSRSKEDAKYLGVYVKDLVIDPKSLALDDQEVVFKYAWVEHAFVVKYKYLFFKEVMKTGKYIFAVQLDKPQKLVRIYDKTDRRSIIWLDREKHSLHFDNNNCFSWRMTDDELKKSIPIKLIVSNRKTGRTQEVVLK